MSVLVVQTLRVADCARAIQQEYYEWGRNKLDHTPEPPWESASPQQRRAVMRRGYSLYDGLPAQPGNEIRLTEIYGSAGIYSRIILNDAIRFLVRAEDAVPFLRRIPDGACLEEATDDQLNAAAELVDLFATAQHVGRGKATKVLHKKRPHFMPILDSVVFDFLWKNFPHIVRQGSPTVEYIRLYRDVLVARRPILSQTQAGLTAAQFPLSMTRVLDFIIWLGWRDKVDQFGLGPPITKVWKTANVPEARKKARQAWEGQCGARGPST